MKTTLSIIGFLVMALPSLASAQAVSASELLENSRITHRKLRNSVESLSRKERRQIQKRLSAIQGIINGDLAGGGNGPTDSASIYGISRRAGGALYSLSLSRPTALSQVSVSSDDGNAKIYNAKAILRNGSSVNLYDLQDRNDFLYSRTHEVSTSQKVVAIEIQAEAWGSGVSLQVEVEGQDGESRFTLDDDEPVDIEPEMHACSVISTRNQAIFLATSSSSKSRAKFEVRKLCEVDNHPSYCSSPEKLVCDSSDGRSQVVECTVTSSRNRGVFFGEGATQVMATAKARQSCQEDNHPSYCASIIECE